MGSDGDLQLNAPSSPGATRSRLERAGITALAGALGLAALFSPIKLCLLALVLCIPCPGCGMTRATFALLHGDFARAFALHPLAPVVAPLATGLLVMQAAGYVRTGDALGSGRAPRAVEVLGAIFVMLLFGVWLARFFGCFGGPVSLH